MLSSLTYLSEQKWGVTPQRVAFLGASRGLGAAVARVYMQARPQDNLFFSARGQEALQKLVQESKAPSGERLLLAADFTKSTDQDKLIEFLQSWWPDRIFYFAGGGPFGPFSSKEWKDHQWALEVSFLFLARLLHDQQQSPQLKQFIAIGSSIAEDKGDPGASSYAAAKHALRGLHSSIKLESGGVDFRLFSPGYMDTTMLPPNAKPRQQELKIADPQQVANELFKWILTDDFCGNYQYSI